MVVIGFASGHVRGNRWIKEFFIDRADLFLRILNSKWGTAEEEAKNIANLLKSIGVGKGSTLLDLGCGNGRISINLAKLGYNVVGIDISPLFINDAKKKALEHGVQDKVEFLVGDARDLDKLLKDRQFDATIMYWTTIIGYHQSREIDTAILKNIWRITKPNGYLLILNHACLESLLIRQSICGQPQYISDIDEEFVLVEKPRYDPSSATIYNTWVFYRKKGKDLVYVDEVSFTLRLYAFHELVEIAREAGWTLHSAYRDLTTLKPYRPNTRSLNIVFKKTQNSK